MQARCLFEYGEAREGYWTCDKFMVQMKKAIKMAEFKYPKYDGWKHVWIFDQSSCHWLDHVFVQKPNGLNLGLYFLVNYQLRTTRANNMTRNYDEMKLTDWHNVRAWYE